MLDPEHARRIAESLVQRGLDAGASAADAVYHGQESTSVEVRLGELESVSRSEGEEMGLRIFVGQRSATVASSDLSDEALGTLVERCLAMAREAPADPFAGLAPSEMLEQGALRPIEGADSADPDAADLKARALDAERAALGVHGVTNSGGASAGASATTLALATSGGFGGAYRTTGYSCSASVVAGEGAGMQRDHDWHGVRHLEDLDEAAEIGRRAGERAVARLDATRPRPGRYPVLFDPRVASSLLGHFSSAINAQSVARKTSFLQDRLEARVFSEAVTIVDDPLRPRGLRSRPFDAEGVRVTQRELVAAGILTGWIAESASARQLGIAPTGHAVRSAGGAPGAAPSNLVMQPGTRSREQLLGAFPEAVLIVELIGQGVNGVTGDYSRGAVGFMVRGGQIAEPVSEITIASNLKDMFATLEPASDLQLRRGIDAPTILVPEMTVGAA
jgi:PmbA protein